MGQGAQVKLSSIEAGVKICDIATLVLEKRAQELRHGLQQARENGWRDEKYNELSEIVESCVGSLMQPLRELEASKRALKRLADAVGRYEDTKI